MNQLTVFFGALCWSVSIGVCLAGTKAEGAITHPSYVQYSQNGYYVGIQGGVSVGVGSNGAYDRIFQRTRRGGFEWYAKGSGNLSLKFGKRRDALRTEFEASYFKALFMQNGMVTRPVNIVFPPMNMNVIVGGVVTPLNLNIPPQRVYIQPGNVPLLRERANLYVFTGNVYYDFIRTYGPLTPFVGLGMGYGFMQKEVNEWNWPRRTTGATSPVFQSMLGLEYAWTSNFTTQLEYKFLLMTNTREFQALGKHRLNIGCALGF